MKITDLRDETSISALGLGSPFGDIGTGGVVAAIQGEPVASATPIAGQAFYFDGTQWLPAQLAIQGTHAARPAAATGNTGWIYWETDTSSLFLSTGSVWTAIGATGFVTASFGGKENVSTVAAAGATTTLDLANGNVFDVTLTANCTISLTGATAGKACSIAIVLRQGGSGSYTVTWPGSVSWPGGTAPTLATTVGQLDVITLFTLDGGTNWFGFDSGSGGAAFATPAIAYGTPAAGAATTAIRSDATIAKPTEADLSLSNVTTGNATTARHGFVPILPNDATKYYDGTGAFTVPPGSGSTIHEVVMQSGTSSPPVPIWNSAGDDWVYSS